MNKITPFLWFNGQAEEAANLYVSLFENSRILHVSRYGDAGPGPAGSAMTVNFELDGRPFIGLNGGPNYVFTEAVSFVINCKTQAEVDKFWDALTEGGEERQCGWLKDRFGLSWQVIPECLGRLMGDPDSKRAGRVMQAMFKMKKIDIAALEAAHAGA
ncbi:MAG: VOC family protein [Acidobacteria bacterium]|nr:VOC family protein [Acidobacteriota bacterium]